MADLIDTTEMYLKTILEMEEDSVTPLRARIVDRLGHSGPTVSQTVARMERDGLLHVMGDRRLELTREGRARAVEVLRKHRLAERLLLDVIGLEWDAVHAEACRWEHVMSDRVEDRLAELLHEPVVDPYGNPVPGSGLEVAGESVELAVRNPEERAMRIVRIGEPIQADEGLLTSFAESDQRARRGGRGYRISDQTCGFVPPSVRPGRLRPRPAPSGPPARRRRPSIQWSRAAALSAVERRDSALSGARGRGPGALWGGGAGSVSHLPLPPCDIFQADRVKCHLVDTTSPSSGNRSWTAGGAVHLGPTRGNHIRFTRTLG